MAENVQWDMAATVSINSITDVEVKEAIHKAIHELATRAFTGQRYYIKEGVEYIVIRDFYVFFAVSSQVNKVGQNVVFVMDIINREWLNLLRQT